MSKTLEPGTIFHVRVPLTLSLSPGYGTVVNRGATIELTEPMLRAATGTEGQLRGALALLGDEAAQLERWGEVRLALGPAPAELREPLPGSAEQDAARREALDRLKHLAPHEQDGALADIKSRYGLEGRSRTIRSHGGAQ